MEGQITSEHMKLFYPTVSTSIRHLGTSDEMRDGMLLAKAGDQAAMGALYQRLMPAVVAYLTRRMGARARRWVTAESLASEVLFETLRGLDNLPDTATEGDLCARLFRIAKSRLWDVLRKHREERGESVASAPRAEPQTPESSAHTVTRRDDRRLLAGLISRLAQGQRDVVRLCGLEGKTYTEVGEILGLRSDTVRKRYHSGVVRLCRMVSGRTA